MTNAPFISVVDDDGSVRASLQRLLKSYGFNVSVFAGAEEFLQSEFCHQTHCLLLDVRMPGMNGLELRRHLTASDCDIPVIFITAHGNEAARVQALQDGAVDYLFKPFREEALLQTIHTALSRVTVAGEKE